MRLYITLSHSHYTVAVWLNEGLRTALFWVIKQRVVVISYRRFEKTHPSHLHISRFPKKTCSPSTFFLT